MLPPFQITGFRFARSEDSTAVSSSGWTDIYLAYPCEYDEVIDGAPQARLTYIDEESDKILVGTSAELVSRLEELIPNPSSPPSFPIVFQIAKPEGLQVWFVYLDNKKPVPSPLSLACAPKAVRGKGKEPESPTSDSSFLEAFERDLKEALENSSPASPTQDHQRNDVESNGASSSRDSTPLQNGLNSEAVVQLLLGGMVNTLNDTLAPLYPGLRNIVPQLQQDGGLKNAAELFQNIGRVAETALQSTNNKEVVDHVAADVQDALKSVGSALGTALGDISEAYTAVYGDIGQSLLDKLRHDNSRSRAEEHISVSPIRPVELANKENQVPVEVELDASDSKAGSITVDRSPILVDAEIDMIAFEEALKKAQKIRSPTVQECNDAPEVAELEQHESDRNSSGRPISPASWLPSGYQTLEQDPVECSSQQINEAPSQPPPPPVPAQPISISRLPHHTDIPPLLQYTSPPHHFHTGQLASHYLDDPISGDYKPTRSPPSPPPRPPPPPPPPPRAASLKKAMSMYIGDARSKSGSATISPPCWGTFSTEPFNIRRRSLEPNVCMVDQSNIPAQYSYGAQTQTPQKQQHQQHRQPYEMDSTGPIRHDWQRPYPNQATSSSVSSGLSHRQSLRGLRSNTHSTPAQAEFGPRVDRMKKAISMCRMQMKYQEDGTGLGESSSAHTAQKPQRSPNRARWSSYISSTPATGDIEREKQLYQGLEQLEQRELERNQGAVQAAPIPPVRPPRPEYTIIPDIAEDENDADTVPLLSRRSTPDPTNIPAGSSETLFEGQNLFFPDRRPSFQQPRRLRPQQSQPNMTQIGHSSSTQTPMMIGLGRDPSFRRPYPRALPTPPTRPTNLLDSQPGDSQHQPRRLSSARISRATIDEFFQSPPQSLPTAPAASSTQRRVNPFAGPPTITPRRLKHRQTMGDLDSLFQESKSNKSKDNKINRCVDSLIEMGYGADEGDADKVDVDRLKLVADITAGDVDDAVNLLEEDREAKKVIRGEERKWNPYR